MWLFFILLVVLVVLLIFGLEGILGRDILRNKENVRENAEIISIKPKSYGHKSSSHFEAVITFSDGSWYRTQCGYEEAHFFYTKYGFDPSQVPRAVEKATDAHNKAVQKAQKKHKNNKDKLTYITSGNETIEKSDSVKDVESLISLINEVTIQSEAAIKLAHEKYEALSFTQKLQVNNFVTLKNCEKKFEQLMLEYLIGVWEQIPCQHNLENSNQERIVLSKNHEGIFEHYYDNTLQNKSAFSWSFSNGTLSFSSIMLKKEYIVDLDSHTLRDSNDSIIFRKTQ